jgi:hypothetical protein
MPLPGLLYSTSLVLLSRQAASFMVTLPSETAVATTPLP